MCFQITYAGISLCSCQDRGVQSCTGLGVFGVLIVTFASASGLGCATVLGIEFNAATTQIVPFLTLGLGVDDMFLLVHNYKEIVLLTQKHQLGYLLKETGLSVLLTSINNIMAFMAGGLLPVPALRSFCIQVSNRLGYGNGNKGYSGPRSIAWENIQSPEKYIPTWFLLSFKKSLGSLLSMGRSLHSIGNLQCVYLSDFTDWPCYRFRLRFCWYSTWLVC